jgi:hypothetical protein
VLFGRTVIGTRVGNILVVVHVFVDSFLTSRWVCQRFRFQRRRETGEDPFEAALIVCGRKDKYQLSPEVTDMLHSLQGAPVMMVGFSTHDAMSKIHRYTPKLNIHDKNRVGVAVEHYEPYIDFEELLRRTTSGNSSFNEPGSISLDDLTRKF